ncbi:cilia- and flagella-associated protein 91 isoform X1 [Neodiprion fabricii]|uniref:cilia- and flagella-associated protein 91 isoform X1 n=1 Tax=Neodiprion fabricii TaxID=2872261 RepID=UPI001ED8D4DD|nr:cilia- and flagella-associated protein 91 isoform X1 [Neodiprion fabricii]
MGCNTSKESVQPTAEEAKEDSKNGDIKQSTEGTGTDETAAAEEASSKSAEANKEAASQGENEKDKDEAATRIQAAFRGHHARKSMKEPESGTRQPQSQNDAEPTQEQLLEEFRADDKGVRNELNFPELCNAATKIQASFRGHMSRKEQQVVSAASAAIKPIEQFVEKTADKIDQKVNDALNELESIDLTDPDLHKAATKIQASFRGHKVRQDGPAVGGTEPGK